MLGFIKQISQKMQSNYVGHEELIILNNIQNYNKSIVNLFKKYNKESTKVLDFGAGIGTLTYLYENKYKVKPDTFDIDHYQISLLRSKGYKVFNNLNEISDNYYDLIFSSNVFEHIEDDYIVFQNLFHKLKKGGIICLYLPANKNLWTELDEKVHHIRRYDFNSINSLMHGTNSIILDRIYCDQMGAIFTLIFKILNLKISKLNKTTLKIFDIIFFPFNKFIPSFLKNTFGKNIFIAIKK
jgi:SAM-dependent methyltransferase